VIDTMLGKYRILQRLGEGGMGTVYKARDELIDRVVAIKVLRPELSRNQQLLDRFRAEAVALARLNHPRIAILHGLEKNGDEMYMVMEFLPGETIEKMIKRMDRVPWQRAVEIACEVLAALDHAHDMGVVHRDIKPANVMVLPTGGVKVMDFGIARITGRDRNTRVGHTVGTPVYMSPEQLRGEEVDGRADIYAVGGMLFEMVTGHVTFEADSDYDLMMKQLNEPPPAPGSMVASLPPALDSVIARALAKRREDRFVSAAAMQAALLAVSSGHRPTPVMSSASMFDPKATRLASDDFAHATPSQPASLQSGRTSGEAARFADGMNVGNETRVAPSDAATTPPITKDWRMWVAATSVAVALAIVFWPRGESNTTIPATASNVGTVGDSTPRRVVEASTPTPESSNPGISQPTTVGGDAPRAPNVATNVPVPVSAPDTTTARPPANPPAASTTQQRPSPSGTSRKPNARQAAPSTATTSSARPATTPPTVTDTSRSAEPPSRTPVREAALTREMAMNAITSFLSLIREKNAAALSSIVSDGASLDRLLSVVREGRASAGPAQDVTVDNGGAVTFS
jgi:serine/threonine-protein kinase